MQLQIVEAARTEILAWASRQQVPLLRVEYVAPFAPADDSLAVWLFYDTDQSVTRYEQDGTSARVCVEVTAILGDLGYPDASLGRVACFFDSVKNVQSNYEGRYFNRLR
jgi:hypothetical protein